MTVAQRNHTYQQTVEYLCSRNQQLYDAHVAGRILTLKSAADLEIPTLSNPVSEELEVGNDIKTALFNLIDKRKQEIDACVGIFKNRATSDDKIAKLNELRSTIDETHGSIQDLVRQIHAWEIQAKIDDARSRLGSWGPTKTREMVDEITTILVQHKM